MAVTEAHMQLYADIFVTVQLQYCWSLHASGVIPIMLSSYPVYSQLVPNASLTLA